MAEFGIDATNLGGPSGAGSQPVAAVQRAGSAPVIPGQLIGSAVDLGLQYVKEDAAEKAGQVFTNYQREVNSISQALQAGSIKNREAMSRVQSISSRYLAENPAAGGDFSKTLANIRKDVFSVTSLQFAEEAREDDRALQKQAKQDAVTKGFLNPFTQTTPELQEAAVNLSQAVVQSDDEWQRQQRLTAENRAQGAEQRAITSAERESTLFAQSQGARGALEAVRTGASQYLTEAIKSARQQVERGGDFLVAQSALQTVFAGIKAQGAEALMANEAAKGVFNQQVDSLMAAALVDLDPTKRSEKSTAEYNDLLKRVQIGLMSSDPNLEVLAGLGGMVGNLPINIAAGNTAVTKVFKAVREGTYSGVILSRDTDTQRTMYQAARDTVNQANAGRTPGDPKAALDDAARFTNNMTAEASKVSPGDPTTLRTYTQYMATPEVASLVSQGGLDKQTAAITKQVWQEAYQRDVLQTVTPKLDTPLGAEVVTDGNTSRPTLSKVVDFQMQGGQLVLVDKVPDGVYASPQLIRSRTQDIRNVMTELNTLIRAGAHLEGTTDYDAYWERNKSNLMPDFFPSPEREAEAKAQGYLGGNIRNAANWKRNPNGGQSNTTNE